MRSRRQSEASSFCTAGSDGVWASRRCRVSSAMVPRGRADGSVRRPHLRVSRVTRHPSPPGFAGEDGVIGAFRLDDPPDPTDPDLKVTASAQACWRSASKAPRRATNRCSCCWRRCTSTWPWCCCRVSRPCRDWWCRAPEGGGVNCAQERPRCFGPAYGDDTVGTVVAPVTAAPRRRRGSGASLARVEQAVRLTYLGPPALAGALALRRSRRRASRPTTSPPV